MAGQLFGYLDTDEDSAQKRITTTEDTTLKKVYLDVASKIEGSGGQQAILDPTTSALATVDYAHREIHTGGHYTVAGFESINSGTTADFSVAVPAGSKHPHMIFSIIGTAALDVRVFRGAVVSGGSAITPRNSNHNYSDNSALTLKRDPSVTSTGTQIDSFYVGTPGQNASRTGGGGADRDEELVLAAGSTTLYRFTSAGDNNIISYRGSWYEHTDRS